MTFLRSLRAKLLGAGLTIALLVIALIAQGNLTLLEDKLIEQTEARMAAIAVAYQTAVVTPLATRDYGSLREILDGWRVKEDVVYLAVIDRHGRILAASGLGPDAMLPTPSGKLDTTARLHHVRLPIEFMGQPMGELQYGLSLEFLQNARHDLMRQSLIIAALAIMLTLLLLGLAAHGLSRRL